MKGREKANLATSGSFSAIAPIADIPWRSCSVMESATQGAFIISLAVCKSVVAMPLVMASGIQSSPATPSATQPKPAICFANSRLIFAIAPTSPLNEDAVVAVEVSGAVLLGVAVGVCVGVVVGAFVAVGMGEEVLVVVAAGPRVSVGPGVWANIGVTVGMGMAVRVGVVAGADVWGGPGV